jgi:phenylacetate-CoA ligase
LSLSEQFVRYVGNRLWLLYKGDLPIYKFRKQFAALWKADRETLDHARLEALRTLLDHAQRTSGYYRSIFAESRFEPDGVKSLTDVKTLPFLTKADMNRDMDSILSNAYPRDRITKSSTGGSSGQPLTFYRDHRVTRVRRSQDLFFNSLLGVYPGMRRAWVWGSEQDAFSMRSVRARIMNFLTERAIYFTSFDATSRSMKEFLFALNRHRPAAIFAYPNMLTALAEFARRESIKVAPVPIVVTTAEPLYDFQRGLLRDVFTATVYERYGSREFGTAAAQIEPDGGLCLFEPCYYFEVIDAEGNPAPDGEMGELVVTDLWNYAMPLIRYRTGDMVKMEAGGSPESGWRRLAHIGGRVVDLLVRPDGSRIAGQAMIMILRQAGVRSKVQVVQNAPDHLTVKHLSGGEVADDVKTELQRKADDLFRASMTIDYLGLEKLEYDKSGKYRYVTSECS